MEKIYRYCRVKFSEEFNQTLKFVDLSTFSYGNRFCIMQFQTDLEFEKMDNAIIYTDGHGVKITDSTFYVHREQYNLDGIREIKLLKLPSRKAPGVVLFVIGFILMLLGSLEALGEVAYETNSSIVLMDADMIAIVGGVMLVVMAILVAILTKSKYAVKITTAEGEKRPLESQNKEYVAHVTNALKRAYYKYVRRKERRKVA